MPFAVKHLYMKANCSLIACGFNPFLVKENLRSGRDAYHKMPPIQFHGDCNTIKGHNNAIR